MTTSATPASEPWSAVLQDGTGPVQGEVLDLVHRTRDSRSYCPELIWGNLQTPDYARAVLRRVVEFHEVPDDIEAGVAARTARAALIGQGGRTYHTLLGEQALRRRFGGVEVMREQLAHLLDATERDGLRLGVIPSRAELVALPEHGFNIYDEDLVSVETVASALDVTEPAEIAVYVKAFDWLRRSAVYGEEARGLIRAELDALG
ncbi:DUF5753 domain-containing protein [Streptomyces sp. NPDC002454]|uniref:DUF5753 domain-containing protein n=1 Tax=Streptomyces sp. NPDC002490 TaxID=3154416 RepID=UPI0033268683